MSRRRWVMAALLGLGLLGFGLLAAGLLRAPLQARWSSWRTSQPLSTQQAARVQACAEISFLTLQRTLAQGIVAPCPASWRPRQVARHLSRPRRARWLTTVQLPHPAATDVSLGRWLHDEPVDPALALVVRAHPGLLAWVLTEVESGRLAPWLDLSTQELLSLHRFERAQALPPRALANLLWRQPARVAALLERDGRLAELRQTRRRRQAGLSAAQPQLTLSCLSPSSDRCLQAVTDRLLRPTIPGAPVSVAPTVPALLARLWTPLDLPQGWQEAHAHELERWRPLLQGQAPAEVVGTLLTAPRSGIAGANDLQGALRGQRSEPWADALGLWWVARGSQPALTVHDGQQGPIVALGGQHWQARGCAWEVSEAAGGPALSEPQLLARVAAVWATTQATLRPQAAGLAASLDPDAYAGLLAALVATPDDAHVALGRAAAAMVRLPAPRGARVPEQTCLSATP